MEEKISGQSLLSNLFFDKETIENIQKIIASIDPNKIESIFNSVSTDEEGWLRIRVDIGIKK